MMLKYSVKHIYYTFVLMLLMITSVNAAQAAIEWQWTNPTPQGNALNGVVYNGTNQYVAVGDFGTVMTSADGLTWVNGSSGITTALNDVVWNGTQYLAVGDFGTVITSADGLTWSTSSAGNVALPLNAVVWDGTQYVAVGNLGEILTSVDGITWITQTTGSFSGFNDIIWTGTQFVVVGGSGSIFTSTNATTWTQQTSPLTSTLHAVAWNGSQFVTVGLSSATMSSPDGITWTTIAWTTFATHLFDVAWNGSSFVAISNGGTTYTSVDGNWGAAANNGDFRSQANAIYTALNSWITVGTGGRIYTSTDALTWTARFAGMKDSVSTLTNNGALTIALGQQCSFMTTADGITWTTYPSAMPASNACSDVLWVAASNLFVALTSSGSTVGNIYTSPDAVSWTLISTTGPTRIQGFAYSPTAGYVAVGTPDFSTGEIWHSADAITWTTQAVPNKLNDVAWVNNQFVAVGNSGAIHTSADGITWATQVSGTAAHLYTVNANANIYVATGSLNTILTSADGVSWLPQISGEAAGTIWSGGLVWTGSQFMLSGQLSGDAIMKSSSDGISWVANNLITNTPLGAVDVFAGKVLAGGSLGVLISGTDVDVVTTISAGATEVTEGGATDSFDMVLTSAPSADVTITLSADPQVTYSSPALVFTTLNWNVPQSMTITAVDDAVSEATANILLTPSVTSIDTRYNALLVADIAVTVFDNDTPAVNITESGGSTAVIEGGVADTYDVVLATLPTANVTVAIGITSAQVTTDVNTLTFTSINWNTPQTVSVTAVDDAIVEGTHSDSISHTVTSTDLNYDALVTPALNISIADNDVGSVSITESGGSTDIAEGGATDSIDVVLGLQPSVDVTVGLTPNAQCTVNSPTLTFTSANWNVIQTATFTAVDDGVVEGNHICPITTSSRSSSSGYNLIAVADININVTDNDSIDVIFTESAGSTDVAEGGLTDAYDVVLNSQPQLNVTVNVAPNAQLSTNNAALIFTPANWNTPQTIVVTAVDDGVLEGSHVGVVSHTITSTDPGYAGFVVADVSVNITDNQAPIITLLGDNPLSISVDSAFADPGYTIADDTDVGLVATVTGTVDTSTIGSYTLAYNVSDAAGNASIEVLRTVDVIDAVDSEAVSSSSGGGCLTSASSPLTLTFMLLLLATGFICRKRQDS